MSIYINKGNSDFSDIRASEYVDKSGMINVINATLNTERRFSCVTRSRRFGKSMAARMLCAYYDESCDSRTLFEDLEIATDPSFDRYLNKFPVIYLDVTDFTTRYNGGKGIVKHIDSDLRADILSVYPKVEVSDADNLMLSLVKIHLATGKKFIMIIDEWDAILRENEKNPDAVNDFVDFLRQMFKGSHSMEVFAGVYMTGILPIKKYKTESALNNFREYSMVSSGRLAPYFGFIPAEVEQLCLKNGVSFDEMKIWYDGYCVGNERSIFNPYSVTEALANGQMRSYWASTGAYDNVVSYIGMNFDGLKDDIITMLSGERCGVDTTGFNNDMSIVNSRDDVLTVLIHLGYLSYDWDTQECFIPNKEVGEEMEKAVKAVLWKGVADAIAKSKRLLTVTLCGDETAVARGVELAHDDNTSILSYNDENSLACVLSIAYYWARNNYIIHREMATGKGFADLVLIPRRNVDSPALVIELKVDRDADTAIDQIKRREYTGKVSEYTGDILLVGISYDRESKTHACRIEPFTL